MPVFSKAGTMRLELVTASCPNLPDGDHFTLGPLRSARSGTKYRPDFPCFLWPTGQSNCLFFYAVPQLLPPSGRPRSLVRGLGADGCVRLGGWPARRCRSRRRKRQQADGRSGPACHRCGAAHVAAREHRGQCLLLRRLDPGEAYLTLKSQATRIDDVGDASFTRCLVPLLAQTSSAL
jgi:hypothetical protein